MMKLKSSAKIHRRYLLIKSGKENVEKNILDYIGILGWARAAPVFLNADATDKIILAVDRKELENVRAAFALSSDKIEVLRVSGTLKGLGK